MTLDEAVQILLQRTSGLSKRKFKFFAEILAPIPSSGNHGHILRILQASSSLASK